MILSGHSSSRQFHPHQWHYRHSAHTHNLLMVGTNSSSTITTIQINTPSVCSLVCFKILISIILLGKACRHWISDEDESSRETYPSRSSTHKLPNFVSTKLPASPFIRPQLTPSVKGTSVTSTPLVSTGHPVVPDMRDGRPRLHLDEVNRFTLCGGSIL